MNEHLNENLFLGKEGDYAKYFASSIPNLIPQEDFLDEADELMNEKRVLAAKSFIQEKDLMIELCNNIAKVNIEFLGKDNFNKDNIDHNQKSAFRIISLLDKYQEHSSLLDTILPKMLTPLMECLRVLARKRNLAEEGLHLKFTDLIFQILYVSIKVRGYKYIFKILPHEVSDLEPCLEWLHKLSPDNEFWYHSYVLQIWLAMLLLIPFDLKTIDSSEKGSMVDQIIMSSFKSMASSNKNKEAGSIVMGKLLTRKDIVKLGTHKVTIENLLQNYLSISKDSKQINTMIGILMIIDQILICGERKEFQPLLGIIIPIVENIEEGLSLSSSILQKFKTRVIQRLGLTLLKPVVAPWRYQRGCRSLTDTMSKQIIATNKNADEKVDETIEIEDPDKLEAIIGSLIDKLKSKDTIVRWSAAKGIGRITERLPKELGNDVILTILGLFEDQSSDSSWHGACLAIAELCRRGLLLPEKLTNFIPILQKSLIFDVQKGNSSVGKNVRDAACYVVWTLARSYSPDIMKPFVESLAPCLIITSLFDRETNCRRAASAAFQEHVGRQGQFPNGIDILTEADYFTVSNRSYAFLSVSAYVSQFSSYKIPIIHHLSQSKLLHWDLTIRNLAGLALSILAPQYPDFMAEYVIPDLCNKTIDPILNVRHGSIIGIAHILIGLSGRPEVDRHYISKNIRSKFTDKEQLLLAESDKKNSFYKSYELLQKINNVKVLKQDTIAIILKVFQDVDSMKFYKGKGGDILRSAVCFYLKGISMAQLPLSKETINLFCDFLFDNFRQNNKQIQTEAAEGFEEFCVSYLKSTDEITMKSICFLLKDAITNENVVITRGYTQAIGHLSYEILKSQLIGLLNTLCTNCLIKKAKNNDAETRVLAVKSIYKIISKFKFEEIGEDTLNKIISVLYKCLEDYSTDKRGDVGSWVREEAMITLQKIIGITVSNNYAGLNDLIMKTVSLILKQLAEKIDKVRQTAGTQLQNIMLILRNAKYGENESLKILQTIFGKNVKFNKETEIEEIEPLEWRNSDFNFRCLIPLLDTEFAFSILSGWVISSGGITESTLKASSNCLAEYSSSSNQEKRLHLLELLYEILKKYNKTDRVTIPTMATLDSLLQTNYFSSNNFNTIIEKILIEIEGHFKSQSIFKLVQMTALISNFLQFDNCSKKAIEILVQSLFHSFPKVRKQSSERLYLQIVSGNLQNLLKSEEIIERASLILGETKWQNRIVELIPVKDELCKCFGIDPLKIIPMKDEEDFQSVKGYENLVKEDY